MPVQKTKTKKPAQSKALGRTKKAGRYFEAVGRRKTAVARIKLWDQGFGEFLVNDKPLEKYFPVSELQRTAKESLVKIGCLGKFKISARVRGGGLHAQAEAVRHGISRVLVKFDSNYRKVLKKSGFLTRDSRMRERKKFGLKRARRAPQWQKR